MPLAYFVTTHTERVSAHIPLAEGETLTYYPGETRAIFDVDEQRYEIGELPDPLPENMAQLAPNPKAVMDVSDPENPTLSHWLLYTVVEKEVPRPRGGMANVSQAPDGPPGTMMVIIRSTEATLNALHATLFAENAALGMYPNSDSITPDEVE